MQNHYYINLINKNLEFVYYVINLLMIQVVHGLVIHNNMYYMILYLYIYMVVVLLHILVLVINHIQENGL